MQIAMQFSLEKYLSRMLGDSSLFIQDKDYVDNISDFRNSSYVWGTPAPGLANIWLHPREKSSLLEFEPHCYRNIRSYLFADVSDKIVLWQQPIPGPRKSGKTHFFSSAGSYIRDISDEFGLPVHIGSQKEIFYQPRSSSLWHANSNNHGSK